MGFRAHLSLCFFEGIVRRLGAHSVIGGGIFPGIAKASVRYRMQLLLAPELVTILLAFRCGYLPWHCMPQLP